MHCHEFEKRLNVRLDERGNPAADDRLAAHAADCEGCRQLLADHASLFAGLSRMNMPALRRSFASRVVTAAAPVTTRFVAPRSTDRTWLALGAALASAAAMLLAISLVWHARHRDAGLADNANPAPSWFGGSRSRLPGLAIAQPPYGGRKSAGRNAPAMTSADFFLAAPRLPSRLSAYRGAIDELAVAFPDAARRLDEMEHLAPGIRPLRASLAMIWDTLCRTIPTTRSDPSAPPNRTSLGWFEFTRIA